MNEGGQRAGAPFRSAGSARGDQVSRSVRLNILVPQGTTENSPAIHRWVQGWMTNESRRDDRKHVFSVVPNGTCAALRDKPSVETLGYYLPSLRDYAKRAPSDAGGSGKAIRRFVSAVTDRVRPVFCLACFLPALLALYSLPASATTSPTNLVVATGDQSVVLHWDPVSDSGLSGYKVYRSTTSAGGPFTLLTSTVVTPLGYCDLSAFAVNGHTNFYYVTAVANSVESAPSVIVPAIPQAFANNNAFLSYVQQTCFDYFWYYANPANGLVPDRTASGSACSIAAVGFGLTAIGIAIDHGWVSRSAGAARVLTTLNTFLQGPQGTNTSGMIGYNGWFYHFLTMSGAVRAGSTIELSSIDTCLLLGGVMYAKQYFNQTNATENAIRSAADTLFNRVNWSWMARNSSGVAMAWYPETGFSTGNWIGYDEGMIIYILGLGTATNPLPASSWNYWTSGYVWETNYGQSYVAYPSLFTYEYSHCWIDFRHTADAYMTARNMSYFINSRRAALAQVNYSIANPNNWPGYGSNIWGLTASDGPNGYTVHGLPPDGNDDGTIAPTAAGGATPFTPEYSVPALLYMYSQARLHIWTAFSFRDAFNLKKGWYDTDELGIDQGPIIIMIENYLTQKPWKLFMQNPEVQRGLTRAGFVSLPTVALTAQLQPAQNSVNLIWNAQTGAVYQVEYSPDLQTWFIPQTGYVTASGSTASWTDTGPPGTLDPPFNEAQRYYRVFRFGSP
ncbi:MAG: hypothetical protein C5B50_25340 [Verrucomicrobia bacterium]|nr:MAG: hypothetical protein C5B50_25340 [Verrucomicrobiota bacterium]